MSNEKRGARRAQGFCLLVGAVIFAATTEVEAKITVSNSETQNISCNAGICSPTATNAVLNAGQLESGLAAGNLTVTTTGTGGIEAQDIEVNAAISWTSQSTLSLTAYRSVTIGKSVAANGASGVSIVTDNGGSGGTFSVGPKGRVTFLDLGSSLAINGVHYTLEDSISSLASAIAANPSGTYALATNYNATGDGTYPGSPIPTELTGSVQGLGNTISHLSISIDNKHYLSPTGLFSQAGAGSVVANLRLTDIKYEVQLDRAGVGGLVGINDGLLFGDQTAGSISDLRRSAGAGGLAGANRSIIENSSSSVKVESIGRAGGLVLVNSGKILYSSASGSIRGSEVGGIVGDNDGGTITQSFATGDVRGAYPGGLVGLNETTGSIQNSYAIGTVTGSLGGGLVSEDTIILGTSISDSYSAGSVSSGAGGFVCQDEAGQSNDYWDTTTSGTTNGTCNGNISGVTGLTTQQLDAGLPTGFDPTIWMEKPTINGGMPFLINNPPQ